MNKTFLITGANGGLGKETARQLALIETTEKIYLGCRNSAKADQAKSELKIATGRDIFEIILMDVSDPKSVITAVNQLNGTVDALIMNAGGMGGKNPGALTKDGVTEMTAANLIGHVVLLDELLRTKKLNNVALYASSEAVRGVKAMGMARPSMKSSSEEEFMTVFDGSYFGSNFDPMQAYGYVKYGATMWLASEARKNPTIRMISMSPGSTSGTDVMNNLSPIMKFMFKNIMMPIVFPLTGMVHTLEKGAKRYIDGISNPDYKSGSFYGSTKGVTGALSDQGELFPDLRNDKFQDNANMAIHRFIKKDKDGLNSNKNNLKEILN